MENNSCSEVINFEAIKPKDVWGTIQSLFCLPNIDMFFYLFLSTIFIFIFKTSQELYMRHKESSKGEMESILNQYIDIHLYASNLLNSSQIEVNELKEFYSLINKSYICIEYNVYMELKSLLADQSRSNTEKIKEIIAIMDKKIPDLIYQKNFFVNYQADFKAPIRKFFISVRDIVIPLGISIGILLIILILAPLFLVQPDRFELTITFGVIFLIGILIYYFDELIKIDNGKNTIAFRITYVSMLSFSILLLFVNGVLFKYALGLWSLSAISLTVIVVGKIHEVNKRNSASEE